MESVAHKLQCIDTEYKVVEESVIVPCRDVRCIRRKYLSVCLHCSHCFLLPAERLVFSRSEADVAIVERASSNAVLDNVMRQDHVLEEVLE